MTVQRLTSKILSSSLAIATCCLVAANVDGQEESTTETQSETRQVEMAVIDSEGLGAPMIFATESTTVDGGPVQMRVMAGDNAMMLAAPGGMSWGAAPDSFSLLNDPSVQKDLELVGDQLQQVRDLQAEFSQQMKDQIGDISKGGFDKERMKGLGELLRRLKEQQKEQMNELLLPHQIDRLQQVALQKHMQRAGTAGALTSEQLVEELGITDEQKERLKKRQDEIKKEMAIKMEKIREDAKNELLMELTAKQREQLKEMIGEKFKPQAKDFQEDMQRRFNLRRGGGQPRSRTRSGGQ